MRVPLVFAALAYCAVSQGAEPSGPADTDYVLKLEQLERIAAAPGEDIFLMKGAEHGFDNLSLILTETQPCGGPPVHVHESEEAHVLYEGCAEYLIGDHHFTVQGPYVARVPANVPHTFKNCGKDMMRLTAIFPTSDYTFRFVRPSPLCVKSKGE